MEQIVSLVRDYMHAEADAGYPLLRQIPSTRATACFDYLESISPAEREELLDARARVTALGEGGADRFGLRAFLRHGRRLGLHN